MAPTDSVNTGDTILDDKIKEWLSWNKDSAAENEIQNYINEGDVKTLSKLFLKRLEFGTAGLRGRMGPGYSQLNDLVIVQTGQGFISYLLKTISNAKQRGVVLGYDGRYNSKRFAELTAAILMNNGVKVYMYSKVCPTPFVPYGVVKYKCAAGIMITASHNPKEDNGYKVYWDNGAQIITPHDKGIQKSIIENLEPLESSFNTSAIYKNSLFKDPLEEVMQSYYKIIKDTTLYPETNRNTILKFTYTPMHGVGYNYMVEAFNSASFKPFVVVEEQKDPDPEFRTVKFPNPEEGKSALDLSLRTANKNASNIILANDPDADRLACAERNEKGEWRVFTGNELGALLGWWMLHLHQVQYPGADYSNVYMLASTVSSKILRSMALKEGFSFEETLTGFKWMGNRATELLAQNKTVIFAYEEAIGFMCGSAVLDKDGVSAGAKVAELAAYLETMGLTLSGKLDEIYSEYGHHISLCSYFFCYEQQIIKSIFERLRNFNESPNTEMGSCQSSVVIPYH
ncbi:phosphopentomutase isoform X2 [Athalia rosae]|uniref:phosphopentomutase isoform X2 n=1 Tax=Athalia rosae TaxID=37344 RepID=UPI002033F765|nr:phosphopentomutase isoform X2 [Athalia rosae]